MIIRQINFLANPYRNLLWTREGCTGWKGIIRAMHAYRQNQGIRFYCQLDEGAVKRIDFSSTAACAFGSQQNTFACLQNGEDRACRRSIQSSPIQWQRPDSAHRPACKWTRKKFLFSNGHDIGDDSHATNTQYHRKGINIAGMIEHDDHRARFVGKNILRAFAAQAKIEVDKIAK